MSACRYLKSVAVLLIFMLTFALVSCGGDSSAGSSQSSFVDAVEEEVSGSSSSSSSSSSTSSSSSSSSGPARDPAPKVLTPTADGTEVQESEYAVIDSSNMGMGYFMVKYTGSASKIKMQVTYNGDSDNIYNYDLTPGGDFETFPFSRGDGSYVVTINENIEGTSYVTVDTITFDVTIEDKFAPYLYPNQYVNFNEDTAAVAVASEVVTGATSELDAIERIFNYVVDNIAYDYEKVGVDFYLPDCDATLADGTGICFDYAVLMAAMLRSQGIPTQLVLGDVPGTYHAWLNVHSTETGTVDQVIAFDGSEWVLMDPTFASSSGKSGEYLEYIGDGTNYSPELYY